MQQRAEKAQRRREGNADAWFCSRFIFAWLWRSGKGNLIAAFCIILLDGWNTESV